MLEEIPYYSRAVAALNAAGRYIMDHAIEPIRTIKKWDGIINLYNLEHADPRAAPKHRNKSHVPNYSNTRHGKKR